MAKNLVKVELHGLQDVLKAIDNIFPKNEAAQRSLLHSGMATSMRRNMLPMAKQ